MSGDIDSQVADREHLRPIRLGLRTDAPKNRLDPQRQLARAKRLDHVVVRSNLETDDAVDLFRFGGQHDHWNTRGFGTSTEAAANLETTDVREHHVEKHEVGLLPRDLGQGIRPAVSHGNAMAPLSQIERDQVGEIDLVLHNQDMSTHRFPSRAWQADVTAP